MDLLKATPLFWRAKLMEGTRVNPVFITSQQVGRSKKSRDCYGMLCDQTCIRGFGADTAGSSWKENIIL